MRTRSEKRILADLAIISGHGNVLVRFSRTVARPGKLGFAAEKVDIRPQEEQSEIVI